MAAETLRLFTPQPGPQQLFADTTADIAVIGGSLYGGKTWALTFDPTRYVGVPGFYFVSFRRVTPEIRNPGGMWDESMGMYPFFGGEPREHQLEWDFPSGARGKFAGLQHDKDVLNWKGSQVTALFFDQLEEFSANQFWYMVSRNRSTCGVKPYIRASCNPDPDTWLATFLAWWIDQDTGYAIPERSGQVRWFVRIQNDLVWGDSKAELVARFPVEGQHARSVTFILARLQDNKVGTDKDPEYESRVRSMPHVEQERLLGGDRGGNWKIRAAAGLVFDRAKLTIVDVAPVSARRIRAWDKAATPGGGDFTAGVRMAVTDQGKIFIEDCVSGQWSSGDRESVIRQTAETDGKAIPIFLEQEGGSGGKDSAASTIINLAGWTVSAATRTGDKVSNAGPLASQVKAGNVSLVRGPWNESFLTEFHHFPTPKVHDDKVDASADAYNQLMLHKPPTATPLAFRWS